MFSIYLITAIVGGVFVLLSALGGDHDHDHDFDADADVDFDADADVDFDADADVDFDADADADFDAHAGLDIHADHGAVAHADVWIPFLSMRFWTYFLAAFGVTGLLLEWLYQPGLVTGLLSGGTGLTAGLGMAYGTRYLKQKEVHSGAGVDDIVGSEADVLITIRGRQPGKVRCHVKGRDLDMLARVDDPDDVIERGATVLIVGFDGPTARVVLRSYALAEDEEPEPAAVAVAEVEEE